VIKNFVPLFALTEKITGFSSTARKRLRLQPRATFGPRPRSEQQSCDSVSDQDLAA